MVTTADLNNGALELVNQARKQRALYFELPDVGSEFYSPENTTLALIANEIVVGYFDEDVPSVELEVLSYLEKKFPTYSNIGQAMQVVSYNELCARIKDESSIDLEKIVTSNGTTLNFWDFLCDLYLNDMSNGGTFVINLVELLTVQFYVPDDVKAEFEKHPEIPRKILLEQLDSVITKNETHWRVQVFGEIARLYEGEINDAKLRLKCQW